MVRTDRRENTRDEKKNTYGRSELKKVEGER